MVDRIEHYAGPDNVACHLDLLLGRGWDVRQHQSGYRYRVIHQSGRILEQGHPSFHYLLFGLCYVIKFFTLKCYLFNSCLNRVVLT